MSQRSLIWPLSLIAAFGTLVVLLIIGATPTPSGAQSDCPTSYTAQQCANFNSTSTASARTATAQAYPDATNTPGSSAPQPTATPTLTTTATLTPTSTLPPATPTLGPTRTPTATRQAGTPTATATSPLAGLETLPCAPGSTVALSGEASPGVALLVYFNDRPVGGALTRRDGSYTVMLRVGDERPGIYPVDLRDRDSRSVVRELACEVPSTTPTPTQAIVP